jgi:deaminated glutathione amidase
MRVGLVQMCSGMDVARNVAEAGRMIEDAASAGAELIVTPEVTTVIAPKRELVVQALGESGDGGAPEAFAALARRLSRHVLVGSMAVKRPDGRLANRSMLFGPDGGRLAVYDKVHMFDVDLASGESYRESRSYAPGDRLVVVEAAGARLGLSVCYDMRFPALYRCLAQAGAGIMTVPSAFTVPTGEAHWHVLLRARAIETGSFILAPAQTGRHESGRQTYGHSLVVGPWGEIVADGGVEPGVILADIDLDLVEDARKRIPALTHDRDFKLFRNHEVLDLATS